MSRVDSENIYRLMETGTKYGDLDGDWYKVCLLSPPMPAAGRVLCHQTESIHMPKKTAKDDCYSTSIDHVMKILVDKMIDVATLKSERGKVERKLKGRKADFLKSRAHHATFPSTEKLQAGAIEEAQKQHNAANEKVKENDSSLSKAAAEFAALLENILETRTIAGSEQQQKLESQFNASEMRARELKNQVDDQQKVIDELKKFVNMIGVEVGLNPLRWQSCSGLPATTAATAVQLNAVEDVAVVHSKIPDLHPGVSEE